MFTKLNHSSGVYINKVNNKVSIDIKLVSELFNTISVFSDCLDEVIPFPYKGQVIGKEIKEFSVLVISVFFVYSLLKKNISLTKLR